MRLSNFFIESIGLYLPESYSTESAVSDGSLDADVRERSGWTGTAVAGDISAPDMAVVAIREALARSRYNGEDLALFLYGSSGIQGVPAWPAHHYVQRKAIGGTAAAVAIDASCNSTLLGLSLAAGYLSLLPAHRAALIAGADNWGVPQFNRYRYAQGVTDRGSNLGDAASAVIVSTEAGFARVESLVNTSLPDFEGMLRPPGPLFPLRLNVAAATDMAARTRSFIQRCPEKLPKLMRDFINMRRNLIDNALADADITMSDVRRVTHVFSGTSRYIEAILAEFEKPWEIGMLDFGRSLGHLSVSDHPAALTHLIVTGEIGVGDRVLNGEQRFGDVAHGRSDPDTKHPAVATDRPAPPGAQERRKWTPAQRHRGSRRASFSSG